MVARVRDIERQRPFNKRVEFVHGAPGGKQVSLAWRTDFGIGTCNAAIGQWSYIANIENVRWAHALRVPTIGDAGAFFADLGSGDMLSIEVPAGTATVTLAQGGGFGSIELSEAQTADSGPINAGDPVTITSGSGARTFRTWFRVDDSTIADHAVFGNFTDTRRVLFIRTRVHSGITADHRAIIDGLIYDVRSIQELANRGELRIALVRIDEGLADVVLGG